MVMGPCILQLLNKQKYIFTTNALGGTLFASQDIQRQAE